MRSGHGISRGIAGAACLTAAALAAIWARSGDERRPTETTASADSVSASPSGSSTSNSAGRPSGLQGGSAEGFEIIRRRFSDPVGPEQSPRILTLPVSEIADALGSIATSYEKLSLLHRTQALALVPPALDRLASHDVGEDWAKALAPIEAVLRAGFGDRLDPARANAAAATIKVWSLLPGRSIVVAEEKQLNEWKIRLQGLTIKSLGDPNPVVRASAVASLGANPTQSGSMPALVALNDDEAVVRAQVILSFGDRVEALPIDAMVPRLNDRDAEVRKLTEKALKRRGLSDRQLELARLATHEDPRARASAVDRLAAMGLSPADGSAASIDPESWLLHLSDDAEPSVRSRSLEGLARMTSTAARKRVEEMAAIDPSPSVRAVARRLASDSGSTATDRPLPPLPDSQAVPASATAPAPDSAPRTDGVSKGS